MSNQFDKVFNENHLTYKRISFPAQLTIFDRVKKEIEILEWMHFGPKKDGKNFDLIRVGNWKDETYCLVVATDDPELLIQIAKTNHLFEFHPTKETLNKALFLY